MVLLVWMGMSHRMVTLSFSVIVLGSCSFHRSFSSKPNYLQILQYICSAALLRRWIARDQVVNSLNETVTQSTFWVHVRLLEDVVLVPACWQALILGCDDKTLGFCLEASCFQPSVVLSWSTRLFHPLWDLALVLRAQVVFASSSAGGICRPSQFPILLHKLSADYC